MVLHIPETTMSLANPALVHGSLSVPGCRLWLVGELWLHWDSFQMWM